MKCMKSIICLFIFIALFGCGGGGGGNTSPKLVSIEVTPSNPVISLGSTQQFTAACIFSDGTTKDITASVNWNSLDPPIATVSNTVGTNGLATSASAGTTTITAIIEDKKASATISIITGPADGTLAEINFHQMAVGRPFGDILKLYNPVIDETGRKLYVTGSKTTYVGVVDLTTDQLVETFDIGVLGGFLIFNSIAKKLYSFDFSVSKCFQIDTVQKTATETSLDICTALVPSKGKGGASATLGNYTFKETGYQSFADGTTGFPTNWRQDMNAAYGVIEIYDSLNVKKGEIVHGPDALYFTIDQSTGKLYTTNTGDGSITIFDLNKLESTDYCRNNACKITDIDIGNSADEVIADSAGTIYVRNRLGGSVIYKYSQSTSSMSVINNENHVSGGIAMWPTGIALSSDERKLFVLSHYGALIDVVDTATNQVTGKIHFNTDFKPRTDSISTMKVDRSRNRLYVSWPELGIIGVADVNNNTVLGTIDLTLYGFDRSKADNAGPGLVTLEVSEKNNRLYAYLKNEQKTLIFNGDTLAEVGETSLARIKVNDEKNVWYVGPRILDAVTRSEISTFSKGQAVIGFNNSDNAVYLYEMLYSGSQKQEKIYEFVDNVLTREWSLDTVGSIGSDVYFDFANHAFYVAYFESGVVKKYSL